MHRLIIGFIALLACTQTQHGYDFEEIPCAPEKMPEFDGKRVTLLDENQNPVRDTLISPIEKRRSVFKPCRELLYRAVFTADNGQEISNRSIKMSFTGKRWARQPDMQDEAVVQYEYSANDIRLCKNHELNKKMMDDQWSAKTAEGVIENVERIWMHPFRHNQYVFTEVAPFPEVRFPLEIGNTWTGSLTIGDGWGDWENTRGHFTYTVSTKEDIAVRYGDFKDCWKIQSTSQYPFGTSRLDYWFDERLGFIRLHYENYGNQTLVIELEQVLDR